MSGWPRAESFGTRRQNTENVELAAAIEPTQQGKRRSSIDLATLLKLCAAFRAAAGSARGWRRGAGASIVSV
jgi:hypothetical protein